MTASSDVRPPIPQSAEGRRLRDAARPPIYRGLPYLWVGAFLAAIYLYRMIWTSGRAQENLLNDWLLYSVLVIGFYFVFGISGQFAFSQAAMFGLGAYTSHWATTNEAVPVLVGPLVAVLVAGLLALAFSLLLRKATHFYFAVGSLALAEVIALWLAKADWFTGGSGGAVVGVRPMNLFGTELDTYFKSFVFLLLTLGVVLCAGYLLQRSPVRRDAIADRDNVKVARTLGVPVARVRTSMFVLGSCVASFAGALWAHRSGTLSIESYGVGLGLGIFLMLVLGGAGSIWGGVIGAWFYVYVPNYLRTLDIQVFGRSLNDYWGIVYGSLLILIMVVLPDGIIGVGRQAMGLLERSAPTFRSRRRATDPPGSITEPISGAEVVADSRTRPADSRRPPAADRGSNQLEVSDVNVAFGGVRAVRDVSFSLAHTEILGLIGPNGSGKSTLLNAVTGVVAARGDIRVAGERVEFGRPESVRAAGVLRGYQTPQTYTSLTCIENVLLSSTDRQWSGIFASTFGRPRMLRIERERWRSASDALERVGLRDLAEAEAGALSYGQQRMLELARIEAADPQVILLDEPSAGLNAVETSHMLTYLQGLRDEGRSLVVVDHKIDFISTLCDRVIVLELGELVAEGDPVEIWDNPRVVNAYLGVTEES